MKLTIIPASILMLGFAGSAFADRAERVLSHLDTNGDQMVSLEEFQPPGKRGNKMFKRADTDGDGLISLDEVAAVKAKRADRMQEKMADHSERMDSAFADMDTNQDGMISREEMRVHHFSRMDVNEDGVLTVDELTPPEHRGMRGGHRGHGQDG